jgi:hypothetical protein
MERSMRNTAQFSLILSLCAAQVAFTAQARAGDLPLNQASAEQLADIEGVDAVLAQRIVELREDRGGRLGSVEALRILSVSASTLDQIREETVLDLSVHKVANKRYSSVEQVLAEFAGEPDVRAVQAMAMSYSKTNPELVEGWLEASSKAFMLPKVNLQYEKQLDISEDYAYLTDENGGLLAELTGSDADNDDKYVVKLEWRLDKLVMSSERIRVINAAEDIVKLRDKVLDEVTRLYFDRRRLQVESLLNPPTSLQSRIDGELRLQELTANLDALTGGSFSAAIR